MSEELIRVRVRTMLPFRRRAGRYFTQQTQTISVTAKDLALLRADSMLAVERVAPGEEDPKPEPTPPEEVDPERIHPLGMNLGVPEKTVPDTSETAARQREERAQADRAAAQSAVVERALPVRVVDQGAPSQQRAQRPPRGGSEG